MRLYVTHIHSYIISCAASLIFSKMINASDLYCVNAFQFPFYIYYYIYTIKLVKFVYSLLIQILYEYKKELPSTVLRSRCTGDSK